MYLFKKILWSKNTYSILKTMFISIIICIVFFLIDYTLGIAFTNLVFLLFTIIAIQVIKKPDKVLITSYGFEIGDKFINWNSVKSVKFDRSIQDILFLGLQGNAFLEIFIPNQVINVTLQNNEEVNIYPRIYDNHKDLRMIFENFIKDRGITYLIRDQGL